MTTAERNKLIAGAGLAVVAAAMLYRSFSGGPPSSTPAARSAATRRQMLESASAEDSKPRAPAERRSPSLKGLEDPSLRLDLLAKVQSVKYEGPERNIFQFHIPAPPPPPKPVADPVKNTGGPPAPGKPPPTPIGLKFYGFSSRPGEAAKKAFLSDGEDIYIAGEGEIVKRRYRVAHIGVNTIELEDIETKTKQTLPLEEGG